MRADIVLFFGAGASKVEPYDYPITTEFFDRALPGIDVGLKNNFLNLVGFMYNEHTVEPLLGKDIEEIMNVLAQLRALNDSTFGNAVSGYLKKFTNERVHQRLSENVTGETINQISATLGGGFSSYLAENATDLEIALKRLIVNVYGGAKELKEISEAHLNLMQHIMGLYNRYNFKKLIPIFTVNYDQVIEACFEKSEYMKDTKSKLEDSFRLDTSWYPMQLHESDDDRFLFQLHKLHGSIDWYLSRGKVFRMHSELELGDLSKHVLLFPGFKSIPEFIPYGHHHDVLGQALDSAKICIVVGFAFRDAYINELFKRAMARQHSDQANLILMIVNPDKDLLLKPPLSDFVNDYTDERVIHFPFKFGKESNQAILDKSIKILDKQRKITL